MKPGIKSTEAWMTAVLALVGPLVTVLVLAGVFDAADAEAVTDTVTTNGRSIVEGVTVLIGNVTSLLGVRKYIGARTVLKIADVQASTE